MKVVIGVHAGWTAPDGATLMVMKVADPGAFRSGRDFSAWLGLTPKDHSTAGKTRLGVITRAGDEALRWVLVAGETRSVWGMFRELTPRR